MVCEPFEHFKQRQGCPFVTSAGSFLFENGARSDGERQHEEPPADLAKRLQRAVEFWTIRYLDVAGRLSFDLADLGMLLKKLTDLCAGLQENTKRR